MKRLPNVATEMALHVLAYNLPRDEHRRYQTVPRGNPGLRSVSRCARRVTVQIAQHGRIDSRLDTAKICSDGHVDVDHAHPL
jgi:hypothetical protein